MRDFTDVYMKERNRANAENDTGSTFFGEKGRDNFSSSMLDLFLAGSETTSTSLTHFCLFLLHNPSIQRQLQDEIDAVVGRERPVQADDEIPLLQAFISEAHRHAAVAPFAVQVR